MSVFGHRSQEAPTGAVFAVFLSKCRERGTRDPDGDGVWDVVLGEDANHAMVGSHQFVSVPWDEPSFDVVVGGEPAVRPPSLERKKASS